MKKTSALFLMESTSFYYKEKIDIRYAQSSRTLYNSTQNTGLPIAKSLSPPTGHNNIPFCPEGIPQAVQTHAGNYTLPMYKEQKNRCGNHSRST